MSRLIKKSIMIPAGATITQADGVLTFKGPKGERTLNIMDGALVKIDATEVWVQKPEDSESPAIFGTLWALIRNALHGVTEGFTKVLEIEGVGYRAAMEGKELVLHLGYALPVRVPVADGVTVVVEKNLIKVSGIDNDLVGRTAAEIRALKKPEPYKGKGIHYQGEVIRRKVGKKAGATAS